MKTHTGGRRRAVTGATLTAAILAVSAIAWACTVQIGTLTICSPIPLPVFIQGQCARKVNTNGTGTQAGTLSVSKTGSQMSVIGSNFVSGDPYSILFNSPLAVANGVNCHQYKSPAVTGTPVPGITSLLGLNASGNPNTVPGPSWSLGALPLSLLGGGITSPNVTTGPTPHTGTAKVCVQEEPNRVNGTQIVFAVI